MTRHCAKNHRNDSLNSPRGGVMNANVANRNAKNRTIIANINWTKTSDFMTDVNYEATPSPRGVASVRMYFR